MYSEGLLYSQRCPCSGEKFIFEKKRQLKLHIFELKKLPTEGGKDSKIMEWMRFLSGKKKEDFKKMAATNPYIGEAIETHDTKEAD